MSLLIIRNSKYLSSRENIGFSSKIIVHRHHRHRCHHRNPVRNHHR